jgi:hypothetical protein
VLTLPALAAAAAILALATVITWLLIGSRRKWPALPPWTWKEIRQLIALLATIAGAAVLTGLAWALLDILRDFLLRILAEKGADRTELLPIGKVVVDGMVWGLKLLLAGVLFIIVSLGWVIGQRQLRAKSALGEFESSGGDDTAPPPTPAAAAERVAGAAAVAAAVVKEEVAAAPPAPEWPVAPPADDGNARPQP